MEKKHANSAATRILSADRPDILTAIGRGETETPEAIFRRYVESKKLKYTYERREILRAVLETHDHFQADELMMIMRERQIRVSKATIYRTITVLLDSGILRETRLSDKIRYYELEYGHGSHDHMLDEKTGQVIEFRSEALRKLIREICDQYGFRMKRHRLQIYGFIEDSAADEQQPVAL